VEKGVGPGQGNATFILAKGAKERQARQAFLKNMQYETSFY
jgi:hypothetical protein